MTPAGLPHSDTPGSQLGCQLPRAYRRLQRPSSALDAKASTMCPSQLVSQTLNKNHKETQPHHPHNHEGNRAQHTKKDQTTTTHTTTPHPLNTQGPGKPSRATTGRCQMLASTIQIPNTPPTNPHPAAQRPDKERRPYRINPTPTRLTPGRRVTGLIPQGPTACQNHSPSPRTPRFHTHPTTGNSCRGVVLRRHGAHGAGVRR